MKVSKLTCFRKLSRDLESADEEDMLFSSATMASRAAEAAAGDWPSTTKPSRVEET